MAPFRQMGFSLLNYASLYFHGKIASVTSERVGDGLSI